MGGGERRTGVLHAYDATNLSKEFYNSDQAGKGATSSSTISSSRRWSPMEESMWEHPTAWSCSALCNSKPRRPANLKP